MNMKQSRLSGRYGVGRDRSVRVVRKLLVVTLLLASTLALGTGQALATDPDVTITVGGTATFTPDGPPDDATFTSSPPDGGGTKVGPCSGPYTLRSFNNRATDIGSRLRVTSPADEIPGTANIRYGVVGSQTYGLDDLVTGTVECTWRGTATLKVQARRSTGSTRTGWTHPNDADKNTPAPAAKDSHLSTTPVRSDPRASHGCTIIISHYGPADRLPNRGVTACLSDAEARYALELDDGDDLPPMCADGETTLPIQSGVIKVVCREHGGWTPHD
jgi:hypothetical protein